MTHRERVEAALARRSPDRCPLQISFTPEFARRLRAHLFGEAGGAHNPHGGGNTYEIERALDLDVLVTSAGWANSYYARDTYNPGGDRYVDEWGVGWRIAPYSTRFGDGFYTEVAEHPIGEMSDLDSYEPPDPNRPELYAEARRVVEEFGGEYWITGGVQTTILETAIGLRGAENVYVEMATEPEFIDRLFEIPHRYHLTAAKRLVEIGVDMIWLGDDIGAQRAMIVSPEMWRRLLRPRLASIIGELKAVNPRLKVAYHTDGYVEPVIPDLIEIGVDVLNPVQPACMDPARLKDEFGDRLCFMGSVDEQRTLPFGSAEDVRRETVARLRTIGRGGGLIIGPTHHVQLDTPVENLIALVDTVKATPH